MKKKSLENTMKALRGIIAKILSACLVLTAAIGACATTLSMQKELSWRNINIPGSQLSVYAIHADKDGIAWLGTNRGLFFYDGTTIRPLSKQLAGSQVFAITENEDKLILGTNNGLMVYSRQEGALKPAADDAPREIRSLAIVGDRLWIGSLFGVHVMDLKTQAITDVSQGLPHNSVYSIIRDRRGMIYAGTFNGLARWNFSANRFESVALRIPDSDKRNLFVNCLMESVDGNSIFIGTEGKLLQFSPSTEVCSEVNGFAGLTIKCLTHTPSGLIIVGTDEGVYELDGDTVRRHCHDSRNGKSLSNDEIWCLHCDNNSLIWAGHDKGFSITSISNQIHSVQVSSVFNTGMGNDIHAILRDSKGVLWLGGTNGVIRISDNDQQWYRHSAQPHALSHNRVRAITEDARHNVWFATDGGLNRYDPGAGNFDVFLVADSAGGHVANWVYSIMEEEGSLWVGSYLGGLHYITADKLAGKGGSVNASSSLNKDSSTLNGNNLALANDLVNAIIKDKSGNKWLLLFRDHEITQIKHDGKCVKHDILAVTGKYPTSIHVDNNGNLWCALNDGIIRLKDNKWSEEVKFQSINGDEHIVAIGNVGNYVWVSTSSGVWSIDANSLQAQLLPLPQKTYLSIYEDKETQKVYLGSIDEITEIDSFANLSAHDDTKMHIILQNWEDKELDIRELGKESLNVPYGGTISFSITDLDYNPEMPQRYMYRLSKTKDDSQDGWIMLPEGTNTITLTGLNMGDYYIMIKSAKSPSTIYYQALHIAAPWWLSWWAFLLYVLILAGIIVSIVLYLRHRSQMAIAEEERLKELENAEKKLTFLSNISHDLKTPLSLIMGPASLLKGKVKDSETMKSVDLIYDNAVKLNNLIHRTIEINQLNEDVDNLLIISQFDAVTFCKSIFDSFRENHKQKNFVFQTTAPELYIDADAVKFESIITNLLSNACKYSQDDATISCGISEGEGEIQIIVSDDGMGISAADQPFVFQRLYRGSSTAGIKEGTGIGLYLIKKYLELMHGNIELISEEQQGTSFIVTLPLSEKNERTSSGKETEGEERRRRVLIVEDNAQISGFIHELLNDDYTCVCAGNGRTGLSLAASLVPDLIITDEIMPVMNGLEMTKKLKQNPRLADIPIIMLTAKDDNTTENTSVKIGIDVFMSKPFDPNLLKARIQQLIEGRDRMESKMRVQSITDVKPIEAESMPEKQLAKIVKVIEDNISDPALNVNLLCEKCEISNKQLYRIIKKYMNTNPLDFIRNIRLQKAAMLLSQKRFTISEVSFMVGFKTPSYFTKCFSEHFGVKPSQYQSDDNISSAE